MIWVQGLFEPDADKIEPALCSLEDRSEDSSDEDITDHEEPDPAKEEHTQQESG